MQKTTGFKSLAKKYSQQRILISLIGFLLFVLVGAGLFYFLKVLPEKDVPTTPVSEPAAASFCSLTFRVVESPFVTPEEPQPEPTCHSLVITNNNVCPDQGASLPVRVFTANAGQVIANWRWADGDFENWTTQLTQVENTARYEGNFVVPSIGQEGRIQIEVLACDDDGENCNACRKWITLCQAPEAPTEGAFNYNETADRMEFSWKHTAPQTLFRIRRVPTIDGQHSQELMETINVTNPTITESNNLMSWNLACNDSYRNDGWCRVEAYRTCSEGECQNIEKYRHTDFFLCSCAEIEDPGPEPEVCEWDETLLADDENCKPCQWNSSIAPDHPECINPCAGPTDRIDGCGCIRDDQCASGNCEDDFCKVATQPTTPVSQPTEPVSQPTTPTEPTTPVSQPTDPVSQPTTPVSQPTTPVANVGPVTLNITASLDGVPYMEGTRAHHPQPAGRSVKMRVILASPVKGYIQANDVVFSYDEATGAYKATNLTFTGLSQIHTGPHIVFLKASRHLGMNFCYFGDKANDLCTLGKLTEAWNTYTTQQQAEQAGFIWLQANGTHTLDLSAKPILAGDLPIGGPNKNQQTGKVTVLDYSAVVGCLGEKRRTQACLDRADLSYTGFVSNYDLGLIRKTLSERADQL